MRALKPGRRDVGGDEQPRGARQRRRRRRRVRRQSRLRVFRVPIGISCPDLQRQGGAQQQDQASARPSAGQMGERQQGGGDDGRPRQTGRGAVHSVQVDHEVRQQRRQVPNRQAVPHPRRHGHHRQRQDQPRQRGVREPQPGPAEQRRGQQEQRAPTQPSLLLHTLGLIELAHRGGLPEQHRERREAEGAERDPIAEALHLQQPEPSACARGHACKQRDRGQPGRPPGGGQQQRQRGQQQRLRTEQWMHGERGESERRRAGEHPAERHPPPGCPHRQRQRQDQEPLSTERHMGLVQSADEDRHRQRQRRGAQREPGGAHPRGAHQRDRRGTLQHHRQRGPQPEVVKARRQQLQHRPHQRRGQRQAVLQGDGGALGVVEDGAGERWPRIAVFRQRPPRQGVLHRVVRHQRVGMEPRRVAAQKGRRIDPQRDAQPKHRRRAQRQRRSSARQPTPSGGDRAQGVAKTPRTRSPH